MVKTLNDDKVIGTDGFTMAFFQPCWDIHKANSMSVFNEFHTRGLFEKSFNSTFIALCK